MFIHPHCPCTKSSLGELAKIVSRCENKAVYECVFVRPQGTPEGWERADLWSTASAIPFVNRIVDVDGQITRHFGAQTSGAVQLYLPDGKLAFSGGITGGRNHDGDNLGADTVTEWILTGQSEHSETFVFGCSLF